MKMKIPAIHPPAPDGFYWDDEDGDVNLRVVGKPKHNSGDLEAWVAYDEEDSLPYYSVRCCTDDTRTWPNARTETLEQAMNWIVAAVILDIRKE